MLRAQEWAPLGLTGTHLQLLVPLHLGRSSFQPGAALHFTVQLPRMFVKAITLFALAFLGVQAAPMKRDDSSTASGESERNTGAVADVPAD